MLTQLAELPVRQGPTISNRGVSAVFGVLLMCMTVNGVAKVLPEDRNDTLWHLYDGGGVTIQGPSVLVRQSYKDKVSVWAN